MYAFNWKRAVERYGDELSEIVAELIVMAGLQGVDFVDTLPRRLYFRILSILRPAEYAARRIILMAACKLEWDIRIVEAKKPAEASPRPLWGPKDGSRRVARPLKIHGEAGRHGKSGERGEERSAVPANRQRFVDWSDERPKRKRRARPSGPRLRPLRSGEGLRQVLSDRRRIRRADEGARRGKISARSIPFARRAGERNFSVPPHPGLADAMQNIDRHAIRLARWKARHMPNGTKAGTVGLKHTSMRSLSRCQPMRIGQPPGWKKHPETAIEEVVKDTHILALDAWDTS
jgi:hypothetical protein